MKYTILFDEDSSCFLVSISGKVSVEGVRTYVNELLNDKRCRDGVHLIVDFAHAEVDALSMRDIMLIPNLINGLKEKIGVIKCAHVVCRPIDVIIIKFWENLIDDNVNFHFRVFSSLGAAKEWIVSTVFSH